MLDMVLSTQENDYRSESCFKHNKQNDYNLLGVF